MRVTIVNGYHDSNKGSCAIAWGLIRRLQKTGLVEAVSLVSMFRKDSPLFGSGFRHLRQNLPAVKYLSSPLMGWADIVHRAGEGAFSLPAQWAWSLSVLQKAISLHSGSELKKQAAREPALQAILESDLVIERGGPFFAAGKSPINPSLYFYAWPLWYARKMGIPYAFAPESIGPLNNPFARRAVKSLFSDSEFISVRESLSKAALMECGVDEQRIQTMLDSAFWVEARRSPLVNSTLEKHRLDPGAYLVIVCRQWTRETQQKFNRELADVIAALIPRVFRRAILVMNAYGPMGGPDDTSAARQLFEMVENKSDVFLVEEDFSPDELVAIYGQAGLVIGARLHSIILALSGGAPVIAVSYGGPKTKGIMHLLELEKFVVEMQTTTRDELCALAQSAAGEQSAVRERLHLRRHRDETLFGDLLSTIIGRHNPGGGRTVLPDI